MRNAPAGINACAVKHKPGMEFEANLETEEARKTALKAFSITYNFIFRNNINDFASSNSYIVSMACYWLLTK